MKTVRIRAMVILVLVVTILTLISTTESVPQRPLCISQFALANHACGLLPITTNSNQQLVEDVDDPDEGERRRRRRRRRTGHGHSHQQRHDHRRHSRRHRRHHHHTQEESDCCRWLKEMDDACVCQLFYRMPTFMRRPKHDYVIKVDDTCAVTFSCQGRLF
ncbi:hypothetical protein BVC80_441g303 [Macleaya cordata]|uniref:Bifunctional inhibitor/plant lipid transfer protein/seed storage helical domain n=1 Tax=Macleaya cordata TaxID=56857 RepID=A0A200Q521_MACCD|nr:hypothetical protein BVC80_441g303 [Macleaya cordata]